MYLGISFIILTDLRYWLGLKIGLVLILYLEMATAAQMYNEMNFENHLMNQAYLHPGNSLGKCLSPLIRDRWSPAAPRSFKHP